MSTRPLQSALIVLIAQTVFAVSGVECRAGQESEIPSLTHISLSAFTDQLYSDIPRTGSEAFVRPDAGSRDNWNHHLHRWAG
jgi:hypothetical protein